MLEFIKTILELNTIFLSAVFWFIFVYYVIAIIDEHRGI